MKSFFIKKVSSRKFPLLTSKNKLITVKAAMAGHKNTRFILAGIKQLTAKQIAIAHIIFLAVK